MVTYGDVRRWRDEPLLTAEERLKKLSDRLLGLSDEYAEMGTPKTWRGPAADAAGRRRKTVTEQMEWIVARASAARRGVGQVGDAIGGLMRGVREAEAFAKQNGLEIGDDGSVRDVKPAQNVPKHQIDDVRRERQRVRNELVDRVEQIMRRAVDIDNELTSVLNQIAYDQIKDGGATGLAAADRAGFTLGSLDIIEPPGGTATPGDNAGWWDTLSDEEKKWIIAHRPDWVGNRDGIPFEARDEANRNRLAAEKERLLAERRRLVGARSRFHTGPYGGNPALQGRDLRAIEQKLQAISAIEKVLARPGERQLALLNLDAPRAEAAVVNGNMDKADHVAVFTPGTGATVPGGLGDYDNEMASLKHRAEAELARHGKGGTVATVSWIGYQAPQWTHDLPVFEGRAEEGGRKLASFLQGIDSARDTDAHVTAIGHSYGSTTTGHALRQNTGVDDVVFLGSPGVGTDHVGGLKVPEGHTTVIESGGDLVTKVGWFGRDPEDMKGVNLGSADEATLPDGRRLSGLSNWNPASHMDYRKDGTTSQYNTSVVVGGMPERMVRTKEW
ncbi:MAG TPA: alpha/beta hydrolase [Actinopolymorphaceae bacterium]